ncbi:uncharacterized protein BCR38DRAFT_457535 [Pseudomassariella vexata]|uniref:Uncharacterized protein n=1 Tax=Pseudomassariella vexata TaxID=1141098 RepID=A0A1Y2E1H3_9PEZI|nr:uncharacterized protein BCR38DRAFT_457535 [Pseudomassariella vexata]ORY65349.1 hypothetical protein BCR38DRAFT_457535 [Pseudomassariella vexata]
MKALSPQSISSAPSDIRLSTQHERLILKLLPFKDARAFPESCRSTLFHPDKTDRDGQEDHMRFIMSIVGDNMLKNLWHNLEWGKRGLEITKAAYEVLSFLRASQMERDQNPPGYEV